MTKRFRWRGHRAEGGGILVAEMDTEYIYNCLRLVINAVFPNRISGTWTRIRKGTYNDEYLRDAYGAFTRALRRRGDPRYRVSDPEVVSWFENKKEKTMSKHKVVVNVGSSATLAELVQEILFKAGYSWGAPGKKVQELPHGYDGIEAGYTQGQISRSPYKSYEQSRATYYSTHTFIDATKDLSKLVELLSKPVVTEVVLNSDYTAVIGKTHTVVGDQKIPNERILAVAAQIEASRK